MRIRQRRKLLGVTPHDLAKIIGLASQQMIRKYETGKHAVSAAALYEIAIALDISVEHFFEGLEEGTGRIADHRPIEDFMDYLGEINNKAYRDLLADIVRLLAAK